ncbi:MAG: hypothetical protein RR382_13520 [Tannerellaceae bacterium]
MKVLRKSIVLKFLLVVLFVSYYVGGTAFVHTHYYHQHLITHSHPYLPGSDGLPHHAHTTAAFETIELLNTLLVEVPPFFALCMGWMLLAVCKSFRRYITCARTVLCANLRAPPYCI